MSSYSIIRITPLPGPGTVERNRRTDFGITGLANFASAAAASFAKKSCTRPGFTSYLKMAITAIAAPLCPLYSGSDELKQVFGQSLYETLLRADRCKNAFLSSAFFAYLAAQRGNWPGASI